jgi:hypothetical protein
MLTGITNALKGISGEFEVNRVVGAFGAAAYIVCGNAFVVWNMIDGRPFNLTEYCLAFPGGLAVAVGAIAGAVAVKDRNVAVAQTVRDTGAMPGKAAEGATDGPSGTPSDPISVAGAETGKPPVETTSQR